MELVNLQIVFDYRKIADTEDLVRFSLPRGLRTRVHKKSARAPLMVRRQPVPVRYVKLWSFAVDYQAKARNRKFFKERCNLDIEQFSRVQLLEGLLNSLPRGNRLA